MNLFALKHDGIHDFVREIGHVTSLLVKKAPVSKFVIELVAWRNLLPEAMTMISCVLGK